MDGVSTLHSNPRSLRAVTQALAFATLALLAIVAVRHFTSDPFFAAQDEGLLIVYPDLILRGFIPYKDFSAFYSPAGFYLLAGVFQIFGESVSVERSLGAAYWFLIVLAVFFIGSRVNRRTALLAAATAVAYLSLFAGLGAYVHYGAYVCMLFALVPAGRYCDANESRAKRLITLAGVVAGAAPWFKQDIGVVAIVATFVSIDPRSLRHLRFFFLGVAIPVSALIAFAIIVGPIDVFDGLILDPLRSSPGRFMPLHLSWDLSVVAACVVIQCVIALRLREPGVPYQLIWLARGMATLSLGYSISMLHRTGPGDIGSYGFVVVSLTVVSLSIFLQTLNFGPQKRVVATIACFVVGMLPVGIIYLTAAEGMKYTQEWVHSGPRKVPFDSYSTSKGSDLQNLLDEINRRSRPGEELFVGQSDLRFSNYNDTFIYYLLPHLLPVSRYLQLDPGCANRQGSGVAREISRADWLILTTRYDDWKEPNASVVPGSVEATDVVRTRFCLQSRYGDWKLLHRCGSESDGSPHGG